MSTTDITILLEDWRKGEDQAFNQLFQITYSELKKLAVSHLRRGWSKSLAATELVHEVYMRLSPYQPNQPWSNRSAFYCLIGKTMLCYLTDHARKQNSKKKGGDFKLATFDDGADSSSEINILTLVDVLARLDKLDERRSRIWQARYLCGLSVEELKQVFNLSNSMLHREIRAASGWLRHKLAS